MYFESSSNSLRSVSIIYHERWGLPRRASRIIQLLSVEKRRAEDLQLRAEDPLTMKIFRVHDTMHESILSNPKLRFHSK